MKASRRIARSVLLGLSFASFSITTATAQNTSSAGGSGGTSFSYKCPEGMVLVMIRGYAGQWIDQIEGICRQPDIATGSWSTATGGTGIGPAGANHVGTASREAKCDPGYAMKEFNGSAGWYVHSISSTCYKLGASARTGTTTKYGGQMYGGSQATPYGPYKCPDSKPAIGIFGRAATYVDRFGLICGYIMPSTPVLISPASGTDVTTKRPTFDWDDARFITKSYKICINTSAGASCSQSGTISATTNTTTTQWAPTTDLPYTRGDIVYWRVEACNDSGCTPKSGSFRFMP